MSFRVFCDGSGTTGGPAGIAFVVYDGQGEWFGESSMSLPDATNQKAEIRAAAFALNELPPLPKVVVVSDSEYVVKGMTVWIDGWRDRARDGVWRNASGGAVENQTDWQCLIDAASRHGHVEFEWTRGHVGTQGATPHPAIPCFRLRESVIAHTAPPAGRFWTPDSLRSSRARRGRRGELPTAACPPGRARTHRGR